MGGAMKRTMKMSLETKLQMQLQAELALHSQQNDERVALYTAQDNQTLDVQNDAIRQTQKLNIEYKYTQATKDMIHDNGESQVSSMLAGLRMAGVLGIN